MANKNRRLDEADSFWELDALMPPVSVPVVSPDVEAVDVVFGSDDVNGGKAADFKSDSSNDAVKNEENSGNRSASSVSERSYSPITHSGISGGYGGKIDFNEWLRQRNFGSGDVISSDSDAVIGYEPENPLITKVTVVKRNGYGKLAERMLADMRKHFGEECEFSENVEFTAYYPQYSKMNSKQLLCYIGFRTAVRHGCFPKVDESYIYLLLYEIINLPDCIAPYDGAMLICSLMNAYSECSDALFTNMCDWLADLCLINKFEAPLDKLKAVKERVYRRATWKEFFIPFRADRISPDACAMLVAASSYDYRSSHYYTEKTAEVFDKHIPAAFDAAISRISADDRKFSLERRETTRLSHEAFRGSLCYPDVRRTISIECVCFTRSPLMRQTVTGLVKFAENYVRELIGVKSRLTVNCLGSEKKKPITEYFEPYIRRKRLEEAAKQTAVVKQVPEYEKLYEPQSTGFSTELAAKIEENSWETTELLLKAFDSSSDRDTDLVSAEATEGDTDQSVEGNVDTDIKDNVPSDNGDSTELTECAGGSKNSKDAVKLAIRSLLESKNADFYELAASIGCMPETLVDMINELAYESYGDIGVTYSDGPIVLEEYRDELTQLAYQ